MENEIHGHAVLELMIEFNQPITKTKLIEAVETRFGKSTRYFTCSKSGMTVRELMEFFESKGKFIFTDQELSTDASKICRH